LCFEPKVHPARVNPGFLRGTPTLAGILLNKICGIAFPFTGNRVAANQALVRKPTFLAEHANALQEVINPETQLETHAYP
jgi:hypothetical protein